MDLTNLQEKIGYKFKNERLLTTALSHSSYTNESGGECNERLEFLGDSVLSLVTTNFLFNSYKKVQEGQLTKIRASLVCEKSLYNFSKSFSLGDHLLLGKGEEQTGGRERASILADAFESLLGAIFLDGGFSAAENFALPFIKESMAENRDGGVFVDYKTKLQEIIQKNREEVLSYHGVGEKGPEHAKEFVAEVHLNSNVIGIGSGKTKKEAEQQAAKAALEYMGE